MKKTTITLALIAAFSAAAHAQSNYTVQHNGTTQFSAATLNISGTTWNFVDGAVPPPPPPPPTGWVPPPGQYLRAGIQYPPNVGNGYATRTNVDLTQFENIWGHLNTTDTATLWPGRAGASPVITNFPRNGYVAAKFTVPANTTVTSTGFFINASNFGGTYLDMSISVNAGDWTTPVPGCKKIDVPPSDYSMVSWRMNNPTNFYCQLTAGTTYYVNIKWHNQAEINPNCPANYAGCRLHTNNNFGR